MDDALRIALSPAHADGLECSEALYRYASGDGSFASDRAFRAHLDNCANCRADLDHFAQPAPATRRSRSLGIGMWIRGFAIAAACAGVFAFLKSRSSETPADSAQALLKAKGAALLHVAVVRNGQTAQWSAVDHLLPGDELLFSYSAPTRVYPMLFSADESGAVEQLFPSGSPALVQPGDGDMGTAEVDKRPGCQWLIGGFLGSDRVPNPDALAATVKQAVARRSRPGCELPAIELEGAQVQVKAKRVLLR